MKKLYEESFYPLGSCNYHRGYPSEKLVGVLTPRLYPKVLGADGETILYMDLVAHHLASLVKTRLTNVTKSHKHQHLLFQLKLFVGC